MNSGIQVVTDIYGAFATGDIPALLARFDPDVRRLLVGDAEGHAQLWDVATWQAIDNPAIESSDIAVGEWSTDGRLVATASSDGQVTVRDGETFEPIRVMIGATGTSNTWGNGTLLFSPDNLTLLTNFDGPGRLWDVATGEQIGDSFPTITGSGASVSDRFHLVTSTENSVLVWNLDMDRWPDIACHVAGAEFTSDEWLQWGPRDQEPHSLCETAS